MNWWARLSLATKLPLALACLLLVFSGTLTLLTYDRVRRTAVTVAFAQLSHAGQQLRDVFNQSVKQRQRQLQTLASRVQSVDPLSVESAEALRPQLEAYAGKDATFAVEVWDAAGSPVASFGNVPQVSQDLRQTWHASAAQVELAFVSAYRLDGADIRYALVAPVLRAGQVVGYVAEHRTLGPATQSSTVLTNLIGAGARLASGNAADGIWAESGRLVAAPPQTFRKAGRWEYSRGPDGVRMLASLVPVDDTPWLVAIELPYDRVLSPATRLLTAAMIATALLTLVGAGAGWALCRRVTTPLRQLTEAAEAITAGGTTTPITTRRQDEVGRLAQSFNAMALEVELARGRLQAMVEDLERRVQERTAALELANHELEAFSYSVSHDLRAPLRAVDGFSRILVEDHAKELSPDALRCVNVIEHRTRHMGQLIDDLLTFSRLGRHPIAKGPVDMTAIASATVEEANRVNATRAVTVTVHVMPAAVGERGLLRQVFDNFIQNAFKFTRDREEATIEIGSHVRGDEIVYFVRDNGVGFDARYADKLFGVFQRLHRAEEFEGTGVGLAIVDRIIRRHGGRVWAESVLGHGATFFFTVPGERAA